MKYPRIITFLVGLIITALLCIGLTMVYSTTYDLHGNAYMIRQALWILIGLSGLALVAFCPLEYLCKAAPYILVAVVASLAYLFAANVAARLVSRDILRFFPLVPGEIKGAMRWLRLGPISIQPSEFAKFALILFLAAYYGTRSKKQVERFVDGVAVPVLVIGVVLGLILLGGDLSTTVITGVTAYSILFLAGVRLRYLVLLACLGVALGVTAINLSPERLSRITSYKAAEEQKMGDGYQLWRSQLTLGSGGLWGRGFTRSVMKQFYLPDARTDFIMAVLGEEFGYVGFCFVLLLHVGLLVCVVEISKMCRDRVGVLMTMGTGILIASQALTNFSVVSGWCPTTGLTAPFLSYGGSSMIAMLLCVGLLFNTCRRNLDRMWQELLSMRVVPTYKAFAMKTHSTQ